MDKKKYLEMDRLKGLGILLVLLGHSIIVYPINIQDISWCMFLHDFIYSFHMPLFFVVSGFLYANSSKRLPYMKNLKKKSLRLLLPYFVFSFFNLMTNYFLNDFVNRKVDNFGEAIMDILLHGKFYWFLYVLFMIFMIIPLLEKLFVNKITTSLIVSILLVLRYTGIGTKEFMLDLVLYYLVFFLCGYFLNRNYDKFLSLLKSKSIILIATVLFLVFNIFSTGIPYILPLLGVFISLAIVLKVKNELWNNLLSFMGDSTLQIYLMEEFLFVIFRVILINILKVNNPAFLIITFFVLKVISSIVIIKFVVKKSNALRLIMGIPGIK